MQKLNIKNLPGFTEASDINEISKLLNNVEKHKLEFVPWTAYPYKPSVLFAISYSSSSILLKFFVQEKQIRALNHKINSSIWEDSCVEFFISFDDDNYYNIEFNCIGTGLIGYGKSKTQRKLLDANTVNQVKALSNINSEKGKKVSWELTMIIPLSVFEHTPLSTLEKRKCRANFYKCGDLLPEPHFVSWSDIKSENPNFHLPDYFGQLVFE
jgi:Carbohydrate-binding family 9